MAWVLDNSTRGVLSWTLVVFARYKPPLQAVLDVTSGCAIGGLKTEYSSRERFRHDARGHA